MEVPQLNEHFFPIILLGCLGAMLLSSSVIYFFFRYQRKVIRQKDELRRVEVQYKEDLVQANIRSQEEERVRISKDLHDQVGSTLSTLRFLVNRFDTAQLGSSDTKALTGEYKEMIDGLITDVRNISHSLAPPGLAIWGLPETLEGLFEVTGKSTGISMSFNCKDNSVLKNLPFDSALSIYRVVQELLANSLKHAGASAITLSISSGPAGINMVYHDNGAGSDKNFNFTTGMGMRNMESRLNMAGASHKIDTAPGKGFSCTISIPAQLLNSTANG